MTQPLVSNPDHIRLAMIGMVEGNGHPFSWSAIINGGYRAEPIRDRGYGGIVDYLSAQPEGALGIPAAQVTHVWCDRRADGQAVGHAAEVAHVVDNPEDVIGQVDAAIIATDIGHEHLERARPFIEAHLPVFIDKPLTDREDHLKQFLAWQRADNPILSTSCMGYAHEFVWLRDQMSRIGKPRLITGTMMKTWERYGIHILEAVYALLPAGGWRWVVNTGDPQANVVHLRHADGVEVVLSVIEDMAGGYGQVTASGTEDTIKADFADTFYAFKAQLQAFVDYLRTGVSPVDFSHTVEQMKIIIAGIRSREEGGRWVSLGEIEP